MPAVDLIDSFARSYLGKNGNQELELVPLKKGASGRTIVRVESKLGLADEFGMTSWVGIHYTNERPDNAAFVPVARFLSESGISVPRILLADEARGLVLVEDIGAEDLTALKAENSWEMAQRLYQNALRELAKIQRLTVPTELREGFFQPPFDAELYRWEQDYFAEHFLGRHLGLEQVVAGFSQIAELKNLREFLSNLPRTLIHRDFQSQNIMVRFAENPVEKSAVLIDFQGMRFGRIEYDLASLVYDAYTALSDEQIAQLLEFWQQETQEKLDLEIFQCCAIQRLMQALGAFANIGYNQQNEWYLQQIGPAQARLSALISKSKLAESLHNIIPSFES